MADRFPKDCWDKKCQHFHTRDLSTDDLVCHCDLLKIQCDACDQDFCLYICPLPNEQKEDGGAMSKYYEADTLLEFVKRYVPTINGETTMQCVERAIKEAPTADVVEVKHGQWENFEIPHMVRCSECGVIDLAIHRTKYNYCPNCGAKMRGGKSV